jgi:hypothetical protein
MQQKKTKKKKKNHISPTQANAKCKTRNKQT